MRLKLLFIILMVVGLGLAAGQAQALTCATPTNLQVMIDKTTGEAYVQWSSASGAITYFIEVYTDLNPLQPIKSYKVSGNLTSFTIPDEDLACGNYKYRVKAECCEDRCDKCDGKFDTKKDYCTNMATTLWDDAIPLWMAPCGCPDPYYSTAVDYSFNFVCSDGSRAGYLCADGSLPVGGVCDDKSIPEFHNCPRGAEVLGCNWECTPRTHYQPKACGAEYEVACKKPAHETIVSSKPTYNLCEFKDPFGWHTKDSLVVPPGVTEQQPPLLYKWQCATGSAKIPDQCFACRRSVCGSPQGQTYFGDLPIDKLCLDADGTLTGTPEVTPTDEGWVWQCKGQPGCGSNNNWVKYWDGETRDGKPNTWKQLETCWALKAACGDASGEFYTETNFRTKSVEKNFLCKGQGQAVGYPYHKDGEPYNEFVSFYDENFTKMIKHLMVWRCVYNKGTPEEKELGCRTNIVGCRSDIIGNNYTQGSFDALKALPEPANFCYNGSDDHQAVSSEVILGWPSTVDITNPLSWTCSDTHDSVGDDCRANLVDCKKPPHGDYYYKNEQAVMADAPLCTAGGTTPLRDSFTSDVPPVQDGWNWDCIDDIPNSVTCRTNLLRCVAPPNQGFFNDWDDFIKSRTGAKCDGKLDMRECWGVCNDPTAPVWVKYNPDSGKWNWDCGDDKCSATKDICNKELPYNGFYVDLEDLGKDVTAQGGSCSLHSDGTYWCFGVCANKDREVNITHDLTTNKFIWKCGDETCEAKQMGCGKKVSLGSPMTKATFDKYVDNEKNVPYSPDFSLCMNMKTVDMDGGTVEWYAKTDVSNTIGDGQPGWTDYWAGEFSDPLWTPFDDHDNPPPVSPPRSYLANEFKGGAALWRCVYGGKSVPATADGSFYTQDKISYCGIWEQGVCADVLVSEADWKNNTGKNSNKYTLNEIRAMADDANHRGNPDLCVRGIVFDGRDVDGSEMLDNHFRCGGVDPGNPKDISYDSCLYKCEGGMNKHDTADVSCQSIDVAACRKSDGIAEDGYKGPHLGTYADQTAFDRAWNSPATNDPNEQTGGCEKGEASDLVYDDMECRWKWKCDDDGYFQCHANKQRLPLTATIVPDDLLDTCATDETPQTLNAVTNCEDISYLRWTASVDGGPAQIVKVSTDNSDRAYTFTAKSLYESLGKISGLYSISYHVVCKDNCFEGGNKEADAKPLTFTIDMGAKQKGASLTDNDDDNTVCVDDSITFTATKDINCQGATYTWTGCTPGSLNASTCTKTYTERKIYEEGDVTVKITCSNCYEDFVGRSPAIKVNKTNDPTGVKLEPDTLEICEDDSDPDVFTATPQYADPLSPYNCTNVKYVWTIGNDIQPGYNSNTFDINNAKPALIAGDYVLSVTAQCQDECSDKTTTPEAFSTVIVKPSTDQSVKVTPTQGDFCQGSGGSDDQPITGIATTACDNSSTDFSFKVVDQNGAGVDGVPDPNDPGNNKKRIINIDTLPPGTYHVEYTLTCNDPNACVDPNPLTFKGGDVYTVNLSFETPSANFDNIPNEFCQKSTDGITVNLAYSLPQDDCLDLKYEWKVDDGAWGGPDSATYPTKDLAIGFHRIYVKVTCQEDCATKPNPASAEFEINIYDCVCGDANGKKFVDNNNDEKIDDLGIYIYCQTGYKAIVPDPPLFTPPDTWTWYCQYGKNLRSPDCSAKKTMCGTASGNDNVYTENSWAAIISDPDEPIKPCTNGSLVTPVNELDKDSEPNENNACTNAIKDTREWTCKDSAEHTTLTCSNKILDCGIADANRILTCGNSGYNKLQPYDSDPSPDGLYSGSYQAEDGGDLQEQFGSHLCTIDSSYVRKATDTKRGKWYWECKDSLSNPTTSVLKCEARRDCDWAVRNQTDANGNVGDGSRYATVDYGSNGCWTAENVGKYNANNIKDLTWGRAARIKITAADTECNTDLPWLNLAPPPVPCKNSHCLSYINSNTCVMEGVCPKNFQLPTKDEWNNLEKGLSGGVCDKNRLTSGGSGVDSGAWSCAPAGDVGGHSDYRLDGLRDRVAFDGQAGAGYWTRSTQPGLPPIRTLLYYKLKSTNEVGRAADYNNNTGVPPNYNCNASESGCQTHEVRCYYNATPPGGSAGGGGGGGDGRAKIPCYGWGCGLSQ